MTISTRLTSILALCAVGLAGCSYVGADADREAASPPALATPAAEPPAQEPAPTPAPTNPTTEPTATSAPSEGGGGGGGEVIQPSDGGGEAALPGDAEGALPTPTSIPLIDTSEGAVTYLRAIQNFSPTIESWQITGSELHYVSYTCVGSVDFEAFASVRPEGDGRSTVRWEGNSPGYGSDSDESLLIDERTLQYSDTAEDDGPANTHYDAEFAEFGRMCSGAGQALAGFVL